MSNWVPFLRKNLLSYLMPQLHFNKLLFHLGRHLQLSKKTVKTVLQLSGTCVNITLNKNLIKLAR